MINKIKHHIFSIVFILCYTPSIAFCQINQALNGGTDTTVSINKNIDATTKDKSITKDLAAPNSSASKSASIITIHSMIDGGLASSIKRRVEIAKDKKADVIIFDIDTFGGRLDSGFEISEYIGDLEDIRTVAFISHKAISAGALIAISCNDIIMVHDAELGDCEPIIPTAEGDYKPAGEKIQTVLRTKFRKYAEKNGYPILLAEAMVTKEIEVYHIKTKDKPDGVFISGRDLKEMNEEDKKNITEKKLIVEEGKLLTMYAKEAYNYGFARHIVDDKNALFQLYNIKKNEITELETNWSEEMVRFLEKMAPILLTIGIITIYLELKAPGFGIFGIIGILCFATIFLSKYMAGLAETPEIIIFFVGIALIAVEIFLIPGFGIAGISGIVFMFIGLILSFQDFTFPQTPYDTQVLQKNLFMIICSFLASSFAIIMLLRYLPGIPLFNRLVLDTAETPDYGFKVTDRESYTDLTGKKAYAITPLHPSGKIEIGEKIFDVVTQGDFVEKGDTVEIVEVKGNRIVVKSV